MSRAPYEIAIRDWLQLVMDEDFAGVPVIFGRQAAPSPDVPTYCVVLFGQGQTIGSPMVQGVDGTTEEGVVITYFRHFAEVVIIGADTRQIAEQLVGRSHATADVVFLRTRSISLIDVGNMVDEDISLDTVWERRATLTLQFTRFSSVVFAPGVIDEVEATPNVGDIPPEPITAP